MNKKTIITLSLFTLLSTTVIQSMHHKKRENTNSQISSAKRHKLNLITHETLESEQDELFTDQELEVLWKQTPEQVDLQTVGFLSLHPEERKIAANFACQTCLDALEKIGREQKVKETSQQKTEQSTNEILPIDKEKELFKKEKQRIQQSLYFLKNEPVLKDTHKTLLEAIIIEKYKRLRYQS